MPKMPPVGGASCPVTGRQLGSATSRPGEDSTMHMPRDRNVVVRFKPCA